MEVEEAREKVQITSEERNAVANYLGSGHAQINALASFDIVQYLTLNNRGWLMTGLDNYEKKEDVGSEILSKIEQLANIYSAMYKYMYSSQCPTKLMRGTSAREASKLTVGGTYDRLLSTTTDKTTAMSFGEAHEPAFLRIIAGNDIPFIDVTEFVGEKKLNRNEEEYILAPFTKIKSSTFRSKYNGYSYYDVQLEKPEMRAFKDGEKEQFESIIQTDFLQIIQLGKELQKLEDEYEMIGRRAQFSHDREDRAYISERRSEILKRMYEITPRVREFSDIIKKYIQGRCSEKEKEFLKAYEVCREEDIKIIKEQYKAAEEARRKTGITDFGNRTQQFEKDSTKVPEELSKQYEQLRNEERKFLEFSKKLGIAFNLNIDDNAISQGLSTVVSNIIEMRRKISSISIGSETKMPEVENALTTVIDYNEALRNVYQTVPQLATIVAEYGDEALANTKKNVDEKAQQILKNTKLRLLDRKRQMVLDRKISLFGRIRGLDKLKTAELEGIELEIQLLKSTPIQVKSNYSIRDILSDMRVFSMSDLGGQMTEEMQSFEETIKGFFSVDDSTIQELAMRKLNAHPMVIATKKRWERTSTKIAKVQKRNEELKIGISKAQYATHKDAQFVNIYDDNSPSKKFERMIQDIAKVTSLPDGQGDVAQVKKTPIIDNNPYVK